MNTLIKGLYENYVSGILPERQYRSLMIQYSEEQEELEKDITELESIIESNKEEPINIDKFINLIKQYKNPQELCCLTKSSTMTEKETGYSRYIVLIARITGRRLDSEESDSYIPVSAEVEAYTPIITKYARMYSVGEYVELIKAVMMQESGCRGNDSMQASESGFNKKYAHEPGSITDPEYSIECGVQAFASVIKHAKVSSPVDMDHIKLALQVYNFGEGYISWAKSKYGGYSKASAEAFAKEQAKKLGWSSYGDTSHFGPRSSPGGIGSTNHQ